MKNMKNFGKRAMSLLLVFIMCVSMLNISVFAAETETEPEYHCGSEEHEHSKGCYETKVVMDLVCENDDEDHEHNGDCYAPVLECGLDESEGHTHGDNCYTTETEEVEEQVLKCGLEESEPVEASEGHTHGNDCYTFSETRTLSCEQAETQGYTHGEDCYDEEGTLICEQVESAGHTHDDDCYTVSETKTLACGQKGSEPVEDSEGHTHSDDCYETETTEVEKQVLKCELDGAEGHKHDENCYKTEEVLTCEVEKHTHTEECLAEAEEPTEEVPAEVQAFLDAVAELPAVDEVTAENAEEIGDQVNAVIDMWDAMSVENGEREDVQDALDNVVYPLFEAVLAAEEIEDPELFISDGGTQTLTSNITVSDTIEITQDTTLNLNGYTITYNGETGSVFHVTGGTFTLNGDGTITGGKGTNVKWAEIVDRDKTNGEPAGGAVLVDSGATFTMNGGTITGNSATWGGGIAVARGGNLNIYGGSITNNTATSAGNDTLSGAAVGNYGGGGGIFCAGTGLIKPDNGNISITGNTTGTVNDLGGGGVFIESKGTMKIFNAVVTGNTASGQGGGVAGCLHGKVSNISPQTAAIYSNNADGTARVTRLKDIDHNNWWYSSKGNATGAAKDYFCAGYSVVGKVSMNGGSANWGGWYVEKNDGKKTIKAASGDPIVVEGAVGLTVGNADAVKAKADAFTSNKVTISSNTSSMHGGGIGCNGTLSFGEESFSYSTSTISIKATKSVSNAQGNDVALNGYTFQLLKGSDVIGTATSDTNGDITFNNLSTAGLFGSTDIPQNATKKVSVSVTLTLKEIAGNKTGMTYDTTPRTITINAERSRTNKGNGNVSTGTGGIDVTTHVFTDTLTGATVSQGSATCTDTTVTLEGAANFTNTMEYGKLTVSKTLSDMNVKNDADEFTFTVTIGGVEHTVTLKAGQSWTSGDYPVGTSYSVVEQSKSGYTIVSNGSVTGTIEKTGSSVTVTNKRNVASLTVKKTVTVNEPSSKLPTDEKAFEIVVTLGNGGGDKVTGKVGENVYVPNGVYTFYLKDGETATITEIPYGTTYTVVETKTGLVESGKEGYSYESGDVKDGKLTNSAEVEVFNHYYEAKYTNVSVTKVWNGGDNYRPMSVTVQLLQNDEEYGNPVYLNKDNNWSYNEWTNLPLYGGDNGVAYTYTVKEVSVNYSELPQGGYRADERDGNIIRVRNMAVKAEDGNYEILGGWIVGGEGTSVTDGTNDTNIVLANTWRGITELGKTAFSVYKVDNETGDAINGVTFTLSKDGEVKDTQTTADGGIATFMYLTDGTYILTETDVPDAYKDVMDEEGNDVNVGRTWKIEIVKNGLKSVKAVNKEDSVGENTWNWKPVSEGMIDNNMSLNPIDETGVIPAGVLAIGNQVVKGKISITKKVVGDKYFNANDFVGKTFKFEVKDSDGNVVDTLSVTTKLAEDGTVTSTTATSKELRYGTYTITEAEPAEVDKYTWESVSFDSVTVEVHANGQTYAVTATNTYTRDLGSMSIQKIVKGDLDASSIKNMVFTFTVKGPEDADGTYSNVKFAKGEATVIIKGQAVLDKNDTVTIEDLPTGKYTVIEDEAKAYVYGYSLDVVIDSADVEKGGTGATTVKNIYSYSPQSNETSLTVKKVWKGDGEIEHPASVTVQLLCNGKVYEEVTLSASSKESENWQYKWSKLPLTDKTGKKNEWTVDEVDVPTGYEKKVTKDGTTYTITNTYTGTTIEEDPSPKSGNLSVTKNWVAGAWVNIPDSVSVQIFKDGQLFKTETLNNGNGWSWSYILSDEELEANHQWTVSEINVPEGFKSSVTVSADGMSFTVTNTYIPETNVPDEPPPTTDIPDEPTPTTDIPDENPPLLDLPEDPVPLIPAEPEIELPEEPVPLVGVPQTGDISLAWYAMAIMSALGLAVLTLKKREDEEA